MGVSRNSVQSPRAYDMSTAAGNGLTRASLRRRLQDVGSKMFERTPGEIAHGVNDEDLNYGYIPGSPERWTLNATPATTPMDTAIQNAIDSADGSYPVVHLVNEYGISAPIIIRDSSTQNISLLGAARTQTLINPLANDISNNGINTLIFNQSTNSHLHLEHMRFWNGNAYSGVAVYAVQGGGTDGSGHSIFSGLFNDLWCSFGGSANGIFVGGFQNCKWSNIDYESTKTACIRLQGLGNADQHYVNQVMFSCFDSFILGDDDTDLKALISLNGLHAYNHHRGPLISLTNCVDSIFERIVLEVSDTENDGTTGVCRLTDCKDIIFNDFVAGVANGVRCATGIIINNGFTGKFSNGKIVGVLGLQLTGIGALDLTLDNVDFIGCDTAIEQDGVSTNLSGKIILRNCRLNDNQLYGILTDAGTASYDVTLINCELVNAGLIGTTTTRVIDITTSGDVTLIRCKMGHDNSGAVAANYVRANGTGRFKIIDPIIVGAPPTAFFDSSNTQAVVLDGVDSSMPGMPQLVPSAGGSATYTTQVGAWSLKNGTVTFEARLTINAIGTGSTSVITGLPFTSDAAHYGGGSCPYFASLNATLTTLGFTIAPSTTAITLRGLTAAAAAVSTPNALKDGADIMFFGSYRIY